MEKGGSRAPQTFPDGDERFKFRFGGHKVTRAPVHLWKGGSQNATTLLPSEGATTCRPLWRFASGWRVGCSSSTLSTSLAVTSLSRRHSSDMFDFLPLCVHHLPRNCKLIEGSHRVAQFLACDTTTGTPHCRVNEPFETADNRAAMSYTVYRKDSLFFGANILDETTASRLAQFRAISGCDELDPHLVWASDHIRAC